MKHATNLEKKQILRISLASFCWSFSSLVIASILPLYLQEKWQVSLSYLGFWEGAAILLSYISALAAGIISDFLPKKVLFATGITISEFCHFSLIFAQGPQTVWNLRCIERFSKGLRGAPTEALIGAWSQGWESKAFGIRQAFYTGGAFFGTLATSFFLWVFPKSYSFLFLLSCMILGISLFWILPASQIPISLKKPRLTLPSQKMTLFLIMTGILAFLRFVEPFLVLRGKEVGYSAAFLPLMIGAADIFHIIFAPLASHKNPRSMLKLGFLALTLSHGCLTTENWVIFGAIAYGIHMGLTQGALRTLITQALPTKDLGSGFGWFFFVHGVGSWLGAWFAGTLGESSHLSSSFQWGALLSGVATWIFLSKKFTMSDPYF